MEHYYDDKSKGFSIEVDEEGKSILLEMVRWTKFLAIISFVMLAIMMLGGFAMGAVFQSAMSQNPALAGISSVAIILYYLVLGAIILYPALLLYRYSIRMKDALQTASKEKFNQAIRYLKNVFQYNGILIIIGLCLYAVFFIFTIIGVMATRSA
jgi:Family of unknown function (DUF5362)